MEETHFQLLENVLFESDKFENLTAYLESNQYSKIFILVDENTERHCLPTLEQVLNSLQFDFTLLTVPAGENSKSIDACTFLWQSITKEKGDRKSLLINLGGGMITDLGGFVASVYKRGINFLNIPTSLLAMVDASVGGKCGIDFNGYKNQLGVFNTACLCLLHVPFLTTLPKEELLSGYAEVLKHVLISKELDVNELPEFTTTPSKKTVQRSIAAKLKIVEEDPLEKGKRKQLNFGHTIGHAIESYFLMNKNPIAHGIAIAAGMHCEIGVSGDLGFLSSEEVNFLQTTIQNKFPKVDFEEEDIDEIMKFLLQDKKNESGTVLFSLLKGIGNCIVNQQVEDKLVSVALRNYINY